MEGRAGEGAHVAGKIRVPGSAQAPSVPLNISPMVWLRQPAPITSACHGAGRQVARATPSFINLTFSSTTQPSLVLSWAPRKYRNPLYLHRHKRPAAQAVQPAKPHRQAGDLAQGAGIPAQLIAVHRRQLLGGAAVGLVIHQHPRAVFEEA